ncbi:hypothetical protein NDU88_003103 [Pleurodeles waltl]|uniref:Uncharacterized protein n=1 Tax=Pleurodeles waltl TaxID=8319 RepID=A0AAV7TNS0_PLEWA|nr:hypothetical protein NDU88_003103 [Pleurodeles waltl]
MAVMRHRALFINNIRVSGPCCFLISSRNVEEDRYANELSQSPFFCINVPVLNRLGKKKPPQRACQPIDPKFSNSPALCHLPASVKFSLGSSVCRQGLSSACWKERIEHLVTYFARMALANDRRCSMRLHLGGADIRKLGKSVLDADTLFTYDTMKQVITTHLSL